MTALLTRRPVRHVLAGLVPLVVVGVVLTVVLAWRYETAAAPVREASARAVATVQGSGLGADGRGVELRWVDQQQTQRTGIVRAARSGTVPLGAQVQVRYVPSDPARVYAAGDETEARLRDIAFGIAVVLLVLLVAVAASVVHVVRRLAARRRPGTAVTVTYARTRRRLLRRSWLVVADRGRTWWLPVHWDPALSRLGSDAEATVHGQPGRGRVVTVDVPGATVWQASGRVRTDPPRGEVDTDEDLWSAPGPAARPATASADAAGIGVGRHLRTDGAVLVAAPLLGLLWAYVDGSGWGGAIVATVLVGAVLLWLPTLLGSDPT
jgi:hypothetical protein